MPASERSLRTTDAYRARLLALRGTAAGIVRREWLVVDRDDLDATHAVWLAQVAPLLRAVQVGAVRLTGAYLTAYLRSELGSRVAGPALDEARYAGVSRAGKPLAEALVGPVITAKRAIADGVAPTDAVDRGLAQAVRIASTETMSAARAALADGIREDGRIIGWRRVTSGGCGACLAAATGAIHRDSEVMPVHDHCRCSAEPVVGRVRDVVQRPTGRDIFDALPVAEQDRRLGPQAAQLARDGAIDLHDLAGRSQMDAIPDQLTQKPLVGLRRGA